MTEHQKTPNFEQLGSIFEAMSDIIWSHAWNATELAFITPSVHRLYQTEPSSSFEQDWWETYVHPEDLAVIGEIHSSLKQDGQYKKSYRIINRSGELKWVSQKGKIIHDENSLPAKVLHTVQDITDKVLSDQALQQEVALQNILIDISSRYITIELDQVDSVIQNSLQTMGEFVQADRAYIFSYDFKAQTTSNTFEWCREGISPEKDNLQAIPMSYFPQWIEKHTMGEPFYIPDVSALPDEGANSLRGILEAQSIKSLITLPMISNHKLLGFVGFDAVNKHHEFQEKERKLLFLFTQMILNINERKASEKHLKQQEEKYRNIITNMNLGILEVDMQEQILYANKRFCEMSGYCQEDLIGSKATDLLLEDSGHQLMKEKRHLRKQGISDNFEVSVKDKKGNKKWWFVSGSPNYNDNGELIGSLGIHLDITAHKKLQKELVAAKEEAEASTRAKELFLANMSHEIRTPMNAITGMTNQLRKTLLDSDQTFYLDIIKSATDNLLIIINDILDLSKIEAGKLSLEEIGFELGTVLTRTMQVMGHKAEEKGLRLSKPFYDPAISPVLIGDPYRLNQVLLNLLSNAVKFTENGSVSLSCGLVADMPESQIINITVTDTGIGMDKGFVENLFKKFHQEDASITRKFGGTGLGLSICKELVALMGGSIEVESKKDQGTAVSLTLPFHKGQAGDLPKEKTASVNTAILQGKTILVTDDNDMNRLVASTVLRNCGANIVEANNGLNAINQIENHPIDLVLMDVQMPVLDGLQATQILRKKGNTSLPIIALTAYALKGDDLKFLESGMNGYLTKPFDENQLLEITVNWLEKAAHASTARAEIKADEAPLFDLEKLDAIAPGNPEFKQKMVNLFQEISQAALKEIKEAHEANDLESIKKIAHRLKPSISSMGISSILTEIRHLESGDISSEDTALYINKLEVVITQVNEKLKSVKF